MSHILTSAVRAPRSSRNGNGRPHTPEELTAGWLLTKRDGRKEPFDPDKVRKALSKCFHGLAHTVGVSVELIDRLTTRVVNFLDAQGMTTPTVEQVQDAVITQLWSEGLDEAATHYTLYREERRKARESRPIPVELIRLIQEDAAHFQTHLEYYQFVSKFARWRDADKRRETWAEANDRVFNWFGTLSQYRYLKAEEVTWLRRMMFERKASPAMRVLQMAGPALERCNLGVYNCSGLAIVDLFSFAELLYILMQGSGCGFSVETEFIGELPRVQRQRKDALKHRCVVADDTEGWCDAFYFGLQKWFGGEDVDFDVSGVRKSGARLKTKGGRASGPGPLLDLLAFARKIILGAQGRQLTDLEVHDICCMTGKIVQVGGVRRASTISLSDLDSTLVRQAKHGDWWLANGQRSMANNSAVYEEKPSVAVFMEEWLALVKSRSGERGIFNRGAVRYNKPARRKDWKFICNPCVTADTLVYVADGRTAVSIGQLAKERRDVPVFCLDQAGELTVRMLRHPRLTGHKMPVVKVALDNGQVLRVTPNHKLRLRSGQYVEARHLKPGDSLAVAVRYTPEQCNGTAYADRYVTIESRGGTTLEHRAVAAFAAGREIFVAEHVHHLNEDRLDNRPDNLTIKNAAAHLSGHSSGAANPTHTGHTNAQLVEYGRKLTRSLGRRFSHSEWGQFAIENSLPRAFSQWRQKSLGTVTAFARLCASLEGLDSLADCDPRVATTYQKAVQSGLDAEVIEGHVYVHKTCEHCSGPFTVPYSRREQGYCSYACSARRGETAEQRQARCAAQQTTFRRKRQETQEQQLGVFIDLQAVLGRQPHKAEWIAACRAAGVSAEISRRSSPFRTWAELLGAADSFNHKVVAVTPDGVADVYNGTVDDVHNFFVGGWDEGLTPAGRRRTVFLNNAQCGEICFRPSGLCNLTISILRGYETIDEMAEKVRAATYFGVLQSCATKFNYVRKEWAKNAEEERLLGVDIMGHLDHPLLRPGAPGREQIVRHLKQVVLDTAQELAVRFGINMPAATTCLKPGGDSGEFFNTVSLSPEYGQYKIRRTREPVRSPVAQFLKDAGVPWEPAAEDEAGLVAFAWPKQAPVDRPTRHDMTAIAQLENWLFWQENWAEHSCSCTVYVKEHEWPAVGAWVWERFDRITGLSFLPWDNGTYRTMPHEEVSKEQYEAAVAVFPQLDWAKLLRYEDEDMTTGAQTYACTAGACERI